MSDPVERATLSGRLPETLDAGAPAPIDPKTGMHRDYWVLSEAERAKGFVRPVRDSYRHVGTSPQHPLRDLTEEEHRRYGQFGYVAYEAYPEGAAALGRYWTQAQLDSKTCGAVTRMGRALAETYAADPKFYGATFCVACRGHFPVAEFTWDGTTEIVGS